MGNKLKAYIKGLRSFLESGQEIEDVESFKRELIREIQFWQHERFVHLIVTFLFAIVTVAVLLTIVLFFLFHTSSIILFLKTVCRRFMLSMKRFAEDIWTSQCRLPVFLRNTVSESKS